MSCITKSIFRFGLIGGLALGGVTLLVGPERMAIGLAQVRTHAQDVVGNCEDDPIALRRQLRDMADEYPDRIAEVRGEVAEVEHQIAQYERDIEVADRVVAMATEDLEGLKTLVVRAETEQANGNRSVAIRMDGIRFDLNEAYDEGRRIQHVRTQYQDRLESDKFQLAFLREQNGRLTEIMNALDDEFSTYQSQLWQLDRQIDAIQRNDRLIELTAAQQATLDSYNRFDTPNLKQIEGQLAKLRAEQEAQLEVLSKRGVNRDYEDRARYEIGSNEFNSNPFADDIIELELKDANDTAADASVWDEPIIIE